MDKVTRVLMLYSRLMKGQIISKDTFCIEMGIKGRSFDRDIEDIRLFLSESYSGYDVKYDRNKKGYFIENLCVSRDLSTMEVILIVMILKETHALRRDEFLGLVSRIIEASDKRKRQRTIEIVKKVCKDYYLEKHNKAILKLFWDLQQCIEEHAVIILKYFMISNEYEEKRVYPLEIVFSGHYFYLIAQCVNADVNPVFYRLDRIESFRIVMGLSEGKDSHCTKISELVNVKVKCQSDMKEILLDAFKDAMVMEESKEYSVLSFQVFKTEFVEWILSQEEYIVVIEPKEVIDEIRNKLKNTLQRYEELI